MATKTTLSAQTTMQRTWRTVVSTGSSKDKGIIHQFEMLKCLQTLPVSLSEPCFSHVQKCVLASDELMHPGKVPLAQAQTSAADEVSDEGMHGFVEVRIDDVFISTSLSQSVSQKANSRVGEFFDTTLFDRCGVLITRCDAFVFGPSALPPKRPLPSRSCVSVRYTWGGCCVCVWGGGGVMVNC